MIRFTRKPIIAFYIHGRQLFAFYNHWIMQYNGGADSEESDESHLLCEKINNANLDYCRRQTAFPDSVMERYLKEQSQFAEGFLFKDENLNVLGFMWVMYRGGNESQYRVRHCDALVFDVFVDEKMRGKGMCGRMLSYVIRYLKEERGASTIRLGVRKNNVSAIKSYKKNGWKIVGTAKFVQFFRRINIPYYSI